MGDSYYYGKGKGVIENNFSLSCHSHLRVSSNAARTDVWPILPRKLEPRSEKRQNGGVAAPKEREIRSEEECARSHENVFSKAERSPLESAFVTPERAVQTV